MFPFWGTEPMCVGGYILLTEDLQYRSGSFCSPFINSNSRSIELFLDSTAQKWLGTQQGKKCPFTSAGLPNHFIEISHDIASPTAPETTMPPENKRIPNLGDKISCERSGEQSELMKCSIYLEGINLAVRTSYDSADPQGQRVFLSRFLRTYITESPFFTGE